MDGGGAICDLGLYSGMWKPPEEEFAFDVPGNFSGISLIRLLV